jgi:TonB family protein
MAAMVALLSCLSAVPASAQDAPYGIDVWAQVRYDVQGQAVEIEFPDRENYPDAFVARMEAVLRERPIEPRKYKGRPADFDTGVFIRLTVTPSEDGAMVAVDAVTQMPRLLRRTAPRMPRAMAGWEGELMVRCMVNPKGRCSDVRLKTAVGVTPTAVRQFAVQSMATWRFEPQKLDGVAVEGEVIVPFRIKSR